jgi:hypothetical protein
MACKGGVPQGTPPLFLQFLFLDAVREANVRGSMRHVARMLNYTCDCMMLFSILDYKIYMIFSVIVHKYD